MAKTGRPGLSREKRVELWERWKAGQCASDIARALARTKGAIHHVLAFNGGIAPVTRWRCPVGLVLDERERLRFEQFSLALHPEKTRLLEFGRKAAATRMQRGLGKPETFTFLGFIFICGKSRRGAFQLQRKTRRDRLRAKLREIKVQLRERMHEPIPEQGRWLKQVVTGFFAYHAVPTNARALSAFRHYVTDLWRRTLRRRSQKDEMTWARITKIAAAWLPQPRILHPWPDQRFAVTHPRWEPSA